MKVIVNPNDKRLLERPALRKATLDTMIADVFERVKEEGDGVLREFTRKFDKVEIAELKVADVELEEAESQISDALKKAIKSAAQNIRLFHIEQVEEVRYVETVPGVKCWRKSVGIDSVGLYIPGGTAPLFSTVLMLAIPAKIAGCKNIILCSPPNMEGKIHPAILYAGKVAGVTQFYKLGGSQAIAAMALGSESIPKVNKLFGPGNQFVTAAKQYAQSQGVAIDMPAGPSEVLVVADKTSNPKFVAADLLSQTEHGPDSQVVLMCDDVEIANKVQSAIEKQLPKLSRKEIAKVALSNSKIFVFDDKDVMIEWMNDYAPEHLILALDDSEYFIDRIVNAGSVFIGHYTPESAGDYASGTNHTLPTNGYAKSYSGVSVDSFIKKITFQHITKAGIQNLGPTIEVLANAEGLDGHARAVSLRMEDL